MDFGSRAGRELGNRRQERPSWQTRALLPRYDNERSAIWLHWGDSGTWLASFTHHDPGYFALEQKTLQPLDGPFGPRLSPMS